MTLPSRTPTPKDRFVWAYSPSRSKSRPTSTSPSTSSKRAGRERVHALRPLESTGKLPRLALCGKGPDAPTDWVTDTVAVDVRVACGRCAGLIKVDIRRFGEPA